MPNDEEPSKNESMWRAWLRRNRRPLLAAAHTACILAIAQFGLAAYRADRVFDRIVESVTTSEMSKEQKALALLHELHRIMWAAKPMFAPKNDPAGSEGWRSTTDSWVADPVDHLATGEGGCGSFTLVLTKALDHANIDVRILQMICNGNKPGCHILLEAHVDGRWVVLDPLFDLSFRREDGLLASYAEVSRDWERYQTQIPEERRSAAAMSEEFYDVGQYDYADVRGTNWQKIPVLMPALRRVLVWTHGEERTKYVSLRSWAYDINHVHLVSALVAYAVLLLLTLRLWWHRRVSEKKLDVGKAENDAATGSA